MHTYLIELPSNTATTNLNLKKIRHCLLIIHFLPTRPSSVMTENSFGMVEDHSANSPSVITEDLNNSAYALRESCPDATYKQIEQAIRHNHGDVNRAAQELLGISQEIPGQGKYKDNSKCDMHDNFTMACLNTI